MALVPAIREKSREPRWPAFIAMLADACVWLALPERFSVGPRWLVPAIILAVLIPIVFTYQRGHHGITRILIVIANSAITMALIGSLVLLVEGLPGHRDPPGTLLRSAAALWMTNLLVFAAQVNQCIWGGSTATQTTLSRR